MGKTAILTCIDQTLTILEGFRENSVFPLFKAILWRSCRDLEYIASGRFYIALEDAGRPLVVLDKYTTVNYCGAHC